MESEEYRIYLELRSAFKLFIISTLISLLFPLWNAYNAYIEVTFNNEIGYEAFLGDKVFIKQFFGHYDYNLFLQLRPIAFIFGVFSAILAIMFSILLLKLFRSARSKLLFAMIFFDFVVCMPLIILFIDFLYRISISDPETIALALIDIFLYGLFLYLINTYGFLRDLKRLSKTSIEIFHIFHDRIISPAFVSLSIFIFIINIIEFSIYPFIIHPLSPYFKVLNLYFIEIPIPDGLFLYYIPGYLAGLSFFFAITTYFLIKNLERNNQYALKSSN